MISIPKIQGFYYGPNGAAPVPIGDLFVETFSPQVGSYTNVGGGSHVVTSGNMAISGGNGFFANGISMGDVVWNGNNWYLEYEFEATNTSNGQFATCFGLQSISAQSQNVYWGLYYSFASNTFELDIFKIVTSWPGDGLVMLPGELIRVRAEFVESTLTVTATNLDTPDSLQVSYTWGYTLADTDIKPNTGTLYILAPVSTINLKSYKFGSLYLVGVDRAFFGDSITSGYYGGGTANRFQDLYAAQTGKSIATFAGAGDRSIELANTIALSYYTQFAPKKIHLLIGTNDIANGVPSGTTQTNINSIITAFQNVGSQVYIGTLLPRNGQNNLPLNTFINGLTGVTIIDYYTAMESSPGSGNINPLYSDDNIHPNAVGEIFMKNLLVSSGF